MPEKLEDEKGEKGGKGKGKKGGKGKKDGMGDHKMKDWKTKKEIELEQALAKERQRRSKAEKIVSAQNKKLSDWSKDWGDDVEELEDLQVERKTLEDEKKEHVKQIAKLEKRLREGEEDKEAKKM
eukprot:gene9823-6321_t